MLSLLDLSSTESQLLAIVANIRGAKDAVMYDQIDYLGYPFSISENFQMRNTHKTIAQSIETLQEILNLADSKNKKVVPIFLWDLEILMEILGMSDIVGEWTEKLFNMGVKILSLSDTVGSSTPEIITYLFSELITKYPSIEFGAHLHTTTTKWKEKVSAAYLAGCRRFDGAIQGFGGCPMAKDDLTGNMPTEKMLSYFACRKSEYKYQFNLF